MERRTSKSKNSTINNKHIIEDRENQKSYHILNQGIKMAIYFTIKEMTESQTAKLQHIDNTPTKEIIENLKKVMYILDMVRVYIGKPIIVNSGYRCEKLNEMVGGVQKSMHTKGLAADFRTRDKEDINTMFEFLKRNQKEFKIIELIKYTNFIHVGVSESLTI